MDDFGKFCYLYVQKTGSTCITAFLKECSRENLMISMKHRPIRFNKSRSAEPGFYRPETYYFNSVRHPFKYYVSLYNFGHESRGVLNRRFKRFGFGELYDGGRDRFHAWLDFVLDEANAAHLHRAYPDVAQIGMGLMTFRFLRLSVAAPKRTFQKLKSYDDIAGFYAKHNISRFTIRNESLSDDLRRLVFEQLPDSFDLEKAGQLIDGERINETSSRSVTISDLEAYPRLDELARKDRFIIDTFYG